MTIQALDVQIAQSLPQMDAGRAAASGRATAVSSIADAAPAKPVDRAALESAVAQTNKMIQPIARDLQFSIDDNTKQTVVKVVDTSTNQVIRQVPSVEMLEIAKALDKLQGLLVRGSA